MSELSFYKDLLVAVATNASNGASASYQLGRHQEAIVPTSILAPANLQSITRVKIQVAHVDVDASYKDIFIEGAVSPIVLTISTVFNIREALQNACLGFEFIRLVTTNSSNVATDPASDITFSVQFAPAAVSKGTNGVEGATNSSAISIDQTTPGTTNAVAIDQTTPGTTNKVVPAGPVASGVAASGNPVPVGGDYNSTAVAITTGQRGILQVNSVQDLWVEVVGSAGGARIQLSGGNNADGIATTGNPAGVNAHAKIYGFNGSTFDRIRTRGTGILQIESAYSFLHVAAGQATTTVKSGAGTLHTITHNGAPTAASTFNAYDNTAASGTLIATILAAAVLGLSTSTYDLAFGTGLTIITATQNWAAYTVTYR